MTELDEFYHLLLLHKVTYHGREISYLKKSEIADLLKEHGAKLCFSFAHEATEPFRQKTSSMLIITQPTWVTFKSPLGFRFTHEHQLALVFAGAAAVGMRIYKAAVRVEEELKCRHSSEIKDADLCKKDGSPASRKEHDTSEFDELYQLLLKHKVTYRSRDIDCFTKPAIAALLEKHGSKACFSFKHESSHKHGWSNAATVTFESPLKLRLKNTGHLLSVVHRTGLIVDQIYKAAVRAEEELKHLRVNTPPPPAPKGTKKEKFLQQLESLGVFTETGCDLVEFFVEHGTRAVKPIYLDYTADEATGYCIPWCGDREKGVRIRPLKFTFPNFHRQLETIERCIRDFFLSDG